MTNRFIHAVPTSSMGLADVEVMKSPTAARIDLPIEVAMKELVDKYRPVRQRTVRSGTTKDKAGALPPAVYYTQPLHSKVMFHENLTVEGQEGMEQFKINFCVDFLVSSELIGYVDFTDSYEIWPKCSLVSNPKKCVRLFLIFQIVLLLRAPM